MERLSGSEIEERVRAAPGWQRDGDAIVRDVTFDDFVGAVGFVDRVAVLAEQADHHPDILIHGYKHVRLTLTTHAAGGLTERDFALAQAIDAIS
jgi:4a-hydroxytetrahydrobiopterin dehydratase